MTFVKFIYCFFFKSSFMTFNKNFVYMRYNTNFVFLLTNIIYFMCHDTISLFSSTCPKYITIVFSQNFFSKVERGKYTTGSYIFNTKLWEQLSYVHFSFISGIGIIQCSMFDKSSFCSLKIIIERNSSIIIILLDAMNILLEIQKPVNIKNIIIDEYENRTVSIKNSVPLIQI